MYQSSLQACAPFIRRAVHSIASDARFAVVVWFSYIESGADKIVVAGESSFSGIRDHIRVNRLDSSSHEDPVHFPNGGLVIWPLKLVKSMARVLGSHATCHRCRSRPLPYRYQSSVSGITIHVPREDLSIVLRVGGRVFDYEFCLSFPSDLADMVKVRIDHPKFLSGG